jgi:hypothetical protein
VVTFERAAVEKVETIHGACCCQGKVKHKSRVTQNSRQALFFFFWARSQHGHPHVFITRISAKYPYRISQGNNAGRTGKRYCLPGFSEVWTRDRSRWVKILASTWQTKCEASGPTGRVPEVPFCSRQRRVEGGTATGCVVNS